MRGAPLTLTTDDPVAAGMEQDTLAKLWTADAGQGLQNKDRPAFVREHADALDEHTDTDDPVPDPESASMAAYRDWLERYKGTVTRQLSEGNDAED